MTQSVTQGGATVPSRNCNGGPCGRTWCGKPAELVCSDRSGLQWFACSAHTEGATTTEPIAEWFQRVLTL